MRVSFIWWPEGMGAVDSPLGGTAAVRAKVIALMRCELLGGNCVVSDNDVVAHAVARSSCCAGLWDLLDVQIGCTTRAMAHWTRDNFGYYLNVFPVLCQLVACAQKPKVARAMLFKIERLLLYNEKHRTSPPFSRRASWRCGKR
jgi:hypothetical protein